MADSLYFDYAASCPPFEDALDLQKEVSLKFPANPSALHHAGKAAAEALRAAKKDICDQLRFHDGRLLACSGASEANSLVLQGVCRRHPGKQILMAADVHDSVWKQPVDRKIFALQNGRIDLTVLKEALQKEKPLLFSMVHVCNETGIIHNASAISKLCRQLGVLCHIDGAQAFGHLPLDFTDIDCDFYSWTAHKFGGPRAVGGLLIRSDAFEPLIYGGRQEWQLRAGTENPAGLHAAARALALSQEKFMVAVEQLNDFRDKLKETLLSEISDIHFNSPADGLPGFLSLSVPGLDAAACVQALANKGLAISKGSACHANEREPSRILQALGLNEDLALGSLRISMGIWTTADAVATLASTLVRYIKNERCHKTESSG